MPRSHAAKVEQVPDILRREQVFAGGDGPRIAVDDFAVEIEIKRVANLLVPAQCQRLNGFGIRKRLSKVETPIGINREPSAIASNFNRRFDALHVLR